MPLTLDTWPSEQGLHIGYLNINNARNKKEEIATILDNNGTNFHVFCFAESRLSPCISDVDMNMLGYQIIRLDPSQPKSTGLLLYVASSLKCKRLTTLECYDVESLWLEISLKNSKPLIVGFVYRNPAETSDWQDRFNTLMDEVTLLSLDITIFGDFNIDLMKPKPKWFQQYTSYGLEQLIDIPTRITANSSTLIDHIYTNSKQYIVEVCAPPNGCSDHKPICLTWLKKHTKIPKVGHKIIYYRNFKNFKEEHFLLDLLSTNLDYIYQIRDPDDAAEFFVTTFMLVYNKHAPFVKKRVKHVNKPPWINKEIELEIKKRDFLSINGTKEEFKKQRNKVTSLKRRSKKAYFQNLLINTKDSRQIWKAINILNNKEVSRSQKLITEVTANELNHHFANISGKVIKTDRSNENDLRCLKEFIDSRDINFPFCFEPVTILDVRKYILELKSSGTRDIDGLDTKILKIACPAIVDKLTYLYNLCIDKQHFPSKFKIAKVIPLHKSGETCNPSNYRPISILSVLSKPFEKHLYRSLYPFLIKNNLLHDNQSGFRENHSCHTALIQLTDTILHNINENRYTGVLFIDFEKAFDVINHSLLMRKLELYKTSLQFQNIISSFLCDRKQCVIVNNERSNIEPIIFGVPQGSVLGPLLFSIYVNDLPLYIKCQSEMFADDTSLLSDDSDANCLTTKLQDNIEKLIKWTHFNHMSLNAVKTKCMYICARQKRQKMKSAFKPLFIKGKLIEEVDSHKMLGVIIDKNLTWTEHISDLGKRLSKKIFQLSKIKHFLDEKSRKLFFSAHILSLIDYASTLWDTCSESNLKVINRLYKRGVKLIMSKSGSLNNANYKEINILPFHKRLMFNKLVCMHNVIYGHAPKKIRNSFNINTLRHRHLLSFPRPRNDLYKSTFLYSGGTLWNNLPTHIKDITTKTQFKKRLTQYLTDH